MIPDVIHIGPLPIHIFGLCLAAAFMVAGQMAGREFERKGYDANVGSQVLVWAAVGGIVGARLWLLLDEWPDFVADPMHFLFTGGGFVFYGGLAGGTLAVTAFFRRHRVPWLRGADACAPAIAIGQAIGRIGCQLSGDGDWGVETTLPWGMAYPYAVVGWDKPPGVHVHPTPIYESVAYFAIVFLLWRMRKRPASDGTVFYWYLVLSGTVRFLVEFIRINPLVAFGLSQAQLVSVVLVAVGGVLLTRERGWRLAAA